MPRESAGGMDLSRSSSFPWFGSFQRVHQLSQLGKEVFLLVESSLLDQHQGLPSGLKLFEIDLPQEDTHILLVLWSPGQDLQSHEMSKPRDGNEDLGQRFPNFGSSHDL